MCAWLDLKRNGDSILSIDIRLALTGPNNYHAAWDAQKQRSAVLVLKSNLTRLLATKKPELPPETKSPLEALKGELSNKKNWAAALPSWGANRVVFRKSDDTEDLVDPLGGISFRQRSVPLKYTLQKFGQAAIPAGEDYFDLTLPGAIVKPTEDSFAPGEFVYLSDHDKVSGPPFEKMKSGLQIASERIEIPPPNRIEANRLRNKSYENAARKISANTNINRAHNTARPD